MKLSKYVKIYPSPEDPDSVILFSTKKTSAVLVPAGLFEEIGNGGLSREEEETLAGLGLLVREPEEEKKEMLDYIAGLNARTTSFQYMVILNLDCNLGCKYCFEGARKGKFYLSDETADLLVDFITRRNYSNKEKITITFYGGEPLLSVESIVRISEKIRAFAEEKGILYSFSLVTNGVLLTPRVVERLAPLGLIGAKVTLDGPEHIHNLFRPFKSGKGSFDVIVRNLKETADMIRLQIGGNYTREYYRQFPLLLDHLADSGLTPARVPLVKFDPVVKESNEFAPPDFHDGCGSINDPWIAEASLYLREEILRRGYLTQKITPSPCVMAHDDSIVMNYDGAFYKCPGLIGRENCRVGDVRNGLTGSRESLGLEDWKNEQCLECAYLPLCFGGCKHMKLVRDGDMRGIDCKKQYFDRTLGELVAQDIRYNL